MNFIERELMAYASQETRQRMLEKEMDRRSNRMLTIFAHSCVRQALRTLDNRQLSKMRQTQQKSDSYARQQNDRLRHASTRKSGSSTFDDPDFEPEL